MLVSSRMLACIVAVLLAAFVTDPARAQTIAGTMERWGLLGTWSTDCSRPPSNRNGYLSYVASGAGKVSYERDFGRGRDARAIRAATFKPGGLIEVVADFGTLGGTRKWAMIKGADGRIRTVANSKLDGTGASVRNGRLVRSGADTPWLSKCRRNSNFLREVRALCTLAPQSMRCP